MNTRPFDASLSATLVLLGFAHARPHARGAGRVEERARGFNITPIPPKT